MVATHRVLRRLSTAAGDILAPADVDASAWANTRALESEGYIRPLTPAERALASTRPAPRAPAEVSPASLPAEQPGQVEAQEQVAVEAPQAESPKPRRRRARR